MAKGLSISIFSIFVSLIFLAGIATEVIADGKLATTWGTMKKGERELRAAPPADVPVDEHAVLTICRLHAGPTDHPADCGAESDVFGSIGKWSGTNSYRLFNYLTSIGLEPTKASLQAAFDQLNGAKVSSGTLPKFSYNSSSSNTLEWKVLDPGVVAQVWTYRDKKDTNKIVRFKMQFNLRYKWFVAAGGETACSLGGDAVDLQDVATHEIGHVYGLGHSQNANGLGLTMYYQILTYGELLKRSLGAGDAAVLDVIY